MGFHNIDSVLKTEIFYKKINMIPYIKKMKYIFRDLEN